MICIKCRKEFKHNEKFCTDCGEKLQAEKIMACPKCGKEFHYNEKFCTDCGEKLQEKKIADGNIEEEKTADEKKADESVYRLVRRIQYKKKISERSFIKQIYIIDLVEKDGQYYLREFHHGCDMENNGRPESRITDDLYPVSVESLVSMFDEELACEYLFRRREDKISIRFLEGCSVYEPDEFIEDIYPPEKKLKKEEDLNKTSENKDNEEILYKDHLYKIYIHEGHLLLDDNCEDTTYELSSHPYEPCAYIKKLGDNTDKALHDSFDMHYVVEDLRKKRNIKSGRRYDLSASDFCKLMINVYKNTKKDWTPKKLAEYKGLILINKYSKYYIRFTGGAYEEYPCDLKISFNEAMSILDSNENIEKIFDENSKKVNWNMEYFADSYLSEYMFYESNMSKEQIKANIDKLNRHDDIKMELYETLIYEKLPGAGVIEVCGYTAPSLIEVKNLSILEAYNFLIYLREDETNALKELNK